MAKLLIVESPGKLKTLRKILGPEWILEASVGHTTELAHDGPKNLGFDIKADRIETRYVPRGTRGRQVLAKLRAAVKKSDSVYLAMDPDREGEAIAWHLVEQLKLKRFVRVSYTQITESAVRAAIQKPRPLDLPLVHAQRARQCLDKLVGYEVSPLLWNSTGGKSAGRVQSATLHLICERERERLAFKSVDYWKLNANYQEGFGAQFEAPKPPLHQQALSVSSTSVSAASSTSTDAARAAVPQKDYTHIDSEAEAMRIEATARIHPHIVNSINDHEERRLPLPPLITSSLQQTAGVRLRFAPQKTMKVAQELYEGINGKGLITYMRTDAVTLSPEFIEETRIWLKANAPSSLADKPPEFKIKADSQGAHEAIRPTSVELTPEKAQAILNREQLDVYRLIWERAVASQCRPATLSRAQIEIFAGESRWIARGMRVLEPGYLNFWRNVEDEKELPSLRKGQILTLKNIEVQKKATQPPSRFSEAKLVQLMEKLGIGRPSTYASTIMTLRDRDYGVVESGVLVPTQLGMATDEVLSRAIPELVDVRFTAQMEASLDQIAESKISWEGFLCEWNSNYLISAMIKAREAVRGVARVVSYFTSGDGDSDCAGGSAGGATRRRLANKPTASTDGARVAAGAKVAAKAAPARVKPQRVSESGEAPSCENGHGPLEARVSKKGAPYWKCAHSGCSSWAWPATASKNSSSSKPSKPSKFSKPKSASRPKSSTSGPLS
jgi:DNA topoisomerase-1